MANLSIGSNDEGYSRQVSLGNSTPVLFLSLSKIPKCDACSWDGTLQYLTPFSSVEVAEDMHADNLAANVDDSQVALNLPLMRFGPSRLRNPCGAVDLYAL